MFRTFHVPLLARVAGRSGGTSWKRNKLRPIAASGRTNERTPVNRALARQRNTAAAQADLIEDMSLAEQAGNRAAASSRGARAFAANARRGADVAHETKSMSDAEWEAVPLSDKHHFCKYVSERLQSAPSEVTEMQRRRYYETTMADPTREDAHRTVRDSYERVKLGLPTHFSLDRSLGVPDAVYEQADASLFDPADATKIENAVTEVKQMFTDYVRKKREGISTEGERRALAAASEELNLATQKHLSEMFKHAENRLQETMRAERERQLKQIARVRAAIERNNNRRRAGGGGAAAAAPAPSKGARATRKEAVARVLRRNYGLDLETADLVCAEMRMQEKFLRECEVLTRMTRGRGFEHSASDQNLDAYAAEIRRIYSMNPEQLCKIDAVQYVAALEGVPPVDWAAAWFGRSLLLPLQSTPEYKALVRVKEEERAALAQQSTAASAPSATAAGDDGGADPTAEEASSAAMNDAAASASGAATPAMMATAPSGSSTKPTAVVAIPEVSAEALETRVVDLATKMFADSDSAELRTMHEKRLRYIAHVHMESQIKRMRENARLFEGAEESAEAEEVKRLYEELLRFRTEGGGGDGNNSNVFEDAEARALFGKMQELVRAYIARRHVESKAEAKSARVAALAEAVTSANEGSIAAQVRKLRALKKREQMQRMLDLLERDVKQELYWIETFADADRPPPLPMPQPMSYVSAGDVLAWRQRELSDTTKDKGNPFKPAAGTIASATFLGQPWPVPDRPLLFWGTGVRAVEQALQHEAQDAERRRRGEPLAPPYPCAENPWGWRLKADPLDEPDDMGEPADMSASEFVDDEIHETQ